MKQPLLHAHFNPVENIVCVHPDSMGQSPCQAMSDPSFWNGTRSKKTKISAISRTSWSTVCVLCIPQFVFKTDQAITISSICNYVFHTTFLKPDTTGIISKAGTEWDTSSLLGTSMPGVHLSEEEQFYSCRKWNGGTFAWGTKCEIRRVLYSE